MKNVRIRLKLNDPSLIPLYTTELAAGADVRAACPVEMSIEPGEIAVIPTGLHLEIPAGYEVQVRPRSGLALKHGVTVLNSPGTIDADYRGEIKVILINHGKQPFCVTYGMRIAQLILSPIVRAEFEIEEEDLMATSRGEAGFGSTGTH